MKKSKEMKNRAHAMKKFFKSYTGKEKSSIEHLIQADYDQIIERAEQLSSIDKSDYPSNAPIMIKVPDAFTKKDRVSYRLVHKEDKSTVLLYDQALVTTLFFGETSLFYHQCNVDHRSGSIAFDIAGEFNYNDVVHMETTLSLDQPENPKYLMLDLELSLIDGSVIPFHLRNHRLHESYELPSLLTDQEQMILDQFKHYIRGKR
ncbi:MAG: hypothetical protein ACLFTZ_01940 [Acholeplasmataceae bacterium]